MDLGQNNKALITLRSELKCFCMGTFCQLYLKCGTSLQLNVFTDGRGLSARTLHKVMLAILLKVMKICHQGFSGRTGWNVRVNCLLNLPSHSCDILKRKDMSRIRLGMSGRGRLI